MAVRSYMRRFSPVSLDNFGDIMTPQEAAHYLKVSDNCIVRHLNAGDIKGFKVGRVWRIKKVDLIDYINNGAG